MWYPSSIIVILAHSALHSQSLSTLAGHLVDIHAHQKTPNIHAWPSSNACMLHRVTASPPPRPATALQQRKKVLQGLRKQLRCN
jgi:hypothetical protein